MPPRRSNRGAEETSVGPSSSSPDPVTNDVDHTDDVVDGGQSAMNQQNQETTSPGPSIAECKETSEFDTNDDQGFTGLSSVVFPRTPAGPSVFDNLTPEGSSDLTALKPPVPQHLPPYHKTNPLDHRGSPTCLIRISIV